MGRVCVSIRAEAYIPGRLAALTAFALEEVIGCPLPTAIGWQILTDESVSIVIDGVSELDRSTLDQLAMETRQLMHGRAANIILVGRSLDLLRHCVPVSRRVRAFQTLPWSQEQQKKLIADVLSLRPGEKQVGILLETLFATLGELCSNPFVLRQSIELSVEKRTAASRSDVYSLLVETRVLRVSALNVDLIEAALGIGLLDANRQGATILRRLRVDPSLRTRQRGNSRNQRAGY